MAAGPEPSPGPSLIDRRPQGPHFRLIGAPVAVGGALVEQQGGSVNKRPRGRLRQGRRGQHRLGLTLIDWGVRIAGGPVRLSLGFAYERAQGEIVEYSTGRYSRAGYDQSDAVSGGGGIPLLASLAFGGIKGALNLAGGMAAIRAAETTVPRITANKIAGDSIRDVIAAREAPALIEQTFTTVGGVRRVDVLKLGDDTLAIESKVGRTSLGSRERQELARDWWLQRQGQVGSVRWEFSPSSVNGGVGPSPALQQKLDKLGFETRINP